MRTQLDGSEVYVATGGKEYVEGQPTIMFLHGSGMDHRAFALQTRWFAFNGFSVLAPDFPAHSLSQGEACESIESSALWLQKLFTRLNIHKAHVVGHSQGFLSALEFSSRFPELVSSITGIGAAWSIPVNQMLLDTANSSPSKAADMMLKWGFGDQIHMGYSPTPGMQPIAASHRIMSSNPLAQDLSSCADYQNGPSAAAKLQIPSAMILAGKDKMTPLKAGLKTAEAMKSKVVILEEHGHILPLEAPKEVLGALKEFILELN